MINNDDKNRMIAVTSSIMGHEISQSKNGELNLVLNRIRNGAYQSVKSWEQDMLTLFESIKQSGKQYANIVSDELKRLFKKEFDIRFNSTELRNKLQKIHGKMHNAVVRNKANIESILKQKFDLERGEKISPKFLTAKEYESFKKTVESAGRDSILRDRIINFVKSKQSDLDFENIQYGHLKSETMRSITRKEY